MGTKKDIGKVFKEHFKDFEQAPDSHTWDSIASELDKNTNRKIMPLWFFFGGLLVVGIASTIWLYNPEENNSQIKNELIENTEKVTERQVEKSVKSDNALTKNTSSKKSSPTTNTAENLTENTRSDQKTKGNHNSRETDRKSKGISQATVPNPSRNPIGSQNTDTRLNIDKQQTSELENIAEDSSSNQNDLDVDDNEKFSKTTQDAQIAQNNSRIIDKDSTTIDDIDEESENNPQGSKEQDETLDENREEQSRKKAELLAQNQKKLKENQKKDKSKNKEISKTSEERENDREKATKYAIAISPYSSILSYGSLTKGSSLDDRLVDNPRDAITTIGYGIRAEYTLSERTRLRVGVGYAPLKYRTSNFQVSIDNGAINIYELAAISGQALNENGSTTQNSPEAIAFFNDNNVVSIQQNLSYLEIPLDFQYMVLNKRLGLSVSPGVSLFILDDNSIVATADSGQSILVGKETNLTRTSLGFNVGLGGHYNINTNWRLNVEPVFRYQLNPYSNKTSNFRPYYFGAQFGLSYKF